MSSTAPKQLLADELRFYARSERHLRPFQAWLSESTPAIPIGAVSDVNDSHSAAARALFPLLRTNRLGGLLLFSPSLPSTQTLVRETLRPAAPAGLVCYTAHQLQGHGRGANSWVSPAGCLTFSFTSALADGATLPFVQYLVSLAILRAVDAVRPTAVAETSAPSPVRIKWPNDIYAGEKVKIGGMLCQSEYRDGKFSVMTGAYTIQESGLRDCQRTEPTHLSAIDTNILSLTAGIGINISNKEPTQCLQDVLSTDGAPCTVTKCVHWREICCCAVTYVLMFIASLLRR